MGKGKGTKERRSPVGVGEAKVVVVEAWLRSRGDS